MGAMGKSWGLVGAFAIAMYAPGAWAQPRTPEAPFNPTRRGTNRWEGSIVALSLGAQFMSEYSTPPVELSLGVGLGPRVWLGRGFQLRGALSFTHPLSSDEGTTVRAETRVQDPSVALWFHGIPSFGNFHPAVAVGLVFPLSEESRARTLLFATDVVARLAWWRRVSSVTLFARASAGWEHRLYEYTTAGVRTPATLRPSCFGSGSGGSCSDQLSGVAAVTDYLWWSLAFAPRWRHFSPGVSFELDMGIPASFASVTTLHSAPSNRYFSTFSTWLEFIPTPPLSVILSYTLSREVLDADGTYGNPFWAPFQQPVVALTVAVRVDELVAVARGEPAGPGGVVRW